MHDEYKSLDRRTFLTIAAAGAGTLALTGSAPTLGPSTRQRSRPNIVFIAADDLSEDQKRDILYNNAARFLRLSEEEIARHHGE